MIHPSVTPEQWLGLERLAVRAVMKMLGRDELNSSQVGRIFSDEGKYRQLEEHIVRAMRECIRGDKHANEVVDARDYVYPKKFGSLPKPVMDQFAILHGAFPEHLSLFNGWKNAQRPQNADGWYVIPYWRAVAKTRADACMRMVSLLQRQRNFNVSDACRDFDARSVRLNSHTEDALDLIHRQQGSAGMLVIPAQFGIAHRGESPDKATETLTRTEFNLGVFEGLAMLYTHPPRLEYKERHWIGLGGEELIPTISGCPVNGILALTSSDGVAGLDVTHTSFQKNFLGCATGFVPQG